MLGPDLSVCYRAESFCTIGFSTHCMEGIHHRSRSMYSACGSVIKSKGASELGMPAVEWVMIVHRDIIAKFSPPLDYPTPQL